MAYEKSWNFSQNVDCNGEYGDVASSAAAMVYNLFHMLSGGNGSTDAAWEIVSASNSSTVAAGGTNITGAGDFIWNSGGAHSWFTARKEMLPSTGSLTRYVYFTMDCSTANNYDIYFNFDHEEPSSAGSTSARPSESTYAYEKNNHQIIPNNYDAGVPHYFHGIIDTSGSWHMVGAKSGNGNGYPFYLACSHIETPKTGTVDPYPVWMAGGYSVSNDGPTYYANLYSTSYAFWNADTESRLSQAVWATYGPKNMEGTRGSDYNSYTSLAMVDAGVSTVSLLTSTGFGAVGDFVDNSWPLLPVYVRANWQTAARLYRVWKGRLPDVHAGPQYDHNYSGAVIPGTGSVQYNLVGALWFPATASWLPGG